MGSATQETFALVIDFNQPFFAFAPLLAGGHAFASRSFAIRARYREFLVPLAFNSFETFSKDFMEAFFTRASSVRTSELELFIGLACHFFHTLVSDANQSLFANALLIAALLSAVWVT